MIHSTSTTITARTISVDVPIGENPPACLTHYSTAAMQTGRQSAARDGRYTDARFPPRFR
jgi:hypothetical protein